MKKHARNLVLYFLLLTLLITPGAALAHDQPSSQPVAAQAAAGLTFDHFFLFYEDPDAPDSPWWQSNTVVDAAGGAHTTFFTNQYIYYAYCPSDCGNPGSWLETPLAAAGGYSSLAFPVLAIDPAGRLRLMRYNHPNYTYAECNANCTQAGNWTEIEVPLGPDLLVIYPTNARYFALDALGRPRFVVPYFNGIVYTACDAGCTSLANWQTSLLELGEGLDHLEIAIDPNNQPRVAGIDNDETLDYLQCNADCAQAASWSSTAVAVQIGWLMGFPNFSLRIDSQGRPRLAFYEPYADDTLHYAWSNANFSDPASWSSYDMPLAPADDRTLDLAIDSQDRPRIAYASDQMDLRYLECTTSCETQNAQWTAYDVETGDELDISNPIPVDPGCLVGIWMMDGYASLALDASGNVNISYHAVHRELCNSKGTYNNASGIRFAHAGDSVTPPPPVAGYKVYLPLLKR